MLKTIILHVRSIVFTYVGHFMLFAKQLCFVHACKSLESIFDCLSVDLVKR